MDKRHGIRNMSVIGHVNHGKSTLSDCLVASSADVHIRDNRGGEKKECVMTVKANYTSFHYKSTEEGLKALKSEHGGNEFIINLIDTPGHVDFSSEVTTALRVSDGALLVVDCVEGVCLQTGSVLHQALRERVCPILTVNKLDQFFCQPNLDGEKVYRCFQKIIEDTNDIISLYDDSLPGDFTVSPHKDTVLFSAGLEGWAFSLRQYAKFYASTFRVDEETTMQRLWGDHFYDRVKNTWSTNRSDSHNQRGFVQLCYKHIKKIFIACLNNQKDGLWEKLDKFGVNLEAEEKNLTGMDLLRCVMSRWLPAATNLVDVSVLRIPSPQTAQRYRVQSLYKGPLDDPYANAIRDCNPDGPLMVYVCKMIPAPTADDKPEDKPDDKLPSFYAFGRVFSGRVSAGSQVRIMGPSYVHDEGDRYSVYVRNLPLDATVADVESEFNKFGNIKPGGIHVRSNKFGFRFGFVEFLDFNSMQNAIQNSPVSIGDREVAVEIKIPTNRDVRVATVKRNIILNGQNEEVVDEVESGNLIMLVGIDQKITSTATITGSNETEAYPICALRFTVRPVVRVTVGCEFAKDLPKLIRGLKCLVKADSTVAYEIEHSGDHVLCAVGELHLKSCLNALQGDYMEKAQIVVSKPYALFSETVSREAPNMVEGMSSNGQNKICIIARKMSIILTNAVENGKIDPGHHWQVNGKRLAKEFRWEEDLATIWCFGPKTTGPNMLVDTHKGVDHLAEVKEYVTSAFRLASRKGVLAGERMRGICFEICDAELHKDPIYRGGHELIRTAQLLFHEAQRAAKPRLIEPLYLVEIQAPASPVEDICSLVNQMRGTVCKKEFGIPMWKIKAYVPVAESFEFAKKLKKFTANCPSPQLVFDHWELLDSDPLKHDSLARKFVNEIRERKGMTPLLI